MQGSNHAIRVASPSGQLSTLAGNGTGGSATGTGTTGAFFSLPYSVALDTANRRLFVGEVSNHAIRQVTFGGVVTNLCGVIGTAGGADGPCASATFNYSSGLAFDTVANRLYVSNRNRNAIRQIDLATMTVSTFAGSTSGTAGALDTVGEDRRTHGRTPRRFLSCSCCARTMAQVRLRSSTHPLTSGSTTRAASCTSPTIRPSVKCP